MRRKFVSAAEAAAVLDCTRETARLYAASGRIPAVRTSAGWMLDADAVTREARMRSQYGRISRQRAERMLASFPAGRRRDEARAVLELLTDKPVRAAAARDDEDDELDPEFASLYPPKTAAEAERRRELAEHIAASRPVLDEDEEFDALFPPEDQP